MNLLLDTHALIGGWKTAAAGAGGAQAYCGLNVDADAQIAAYDVPTLDASH